MVALLFLLGRIDVGRISLIKSNHVKTKRFFDILGDYWTVLQSGGNNDARGHIEYVFFVFKCYLHFCSQIAGVLIVKTCENKL